MTYSEKHRRIIQVTKWLEEETARLVLGELRKIIKVFAKERDLTDDIRRFMERLKSHPK